MSRDNFSVKVKRELGLLSSGYCMICRRPVSIPNYAHIIPASEKGPRSEFRNKYNQDFIISKKNGLCLCPDCHALIDDPSTNRYSLEELFKINQRFQNEYDLKEEYKNQLGIYNQVTDKEIKDIYNRIYLYLNSEDDMPAEENYDKIPYDKKMEKNGFNKYHQHEINFFYSEEFSAFYNAIQNMPIAAIKLRAAVSTLYVRLSSDEEDGNKIIEQMINIMFDPSEKHIGNKITLFYYFIICEVFKK